MKENKEIKRRNYYQTIVGAHTRKTLTRKVVNTRGSKDRPVSIERTFTANFIACTAADIPMFFHSRNISTESEKLIEVRQRDTRHRS